MNAAVWCPRLQVYCCGIAYDVCVAFTALHGAELGYVTYVVEDACRGVTDEGIAEKKEIFEQIFEAHRNLVNRKN